MIKKTGIATTSNTGTMSSTTPTRAISIVYLFMDDRGEAQASVCFAGQYQMDAVYDTPIKRTIGRANDHSR